MSLLYLTSALNESKRNGKLSFSTVLGAAAELQSAKGCNVHRGG
jgi:hypothetical protein